MEKLRLLIAEDDDLIRAIYVRSLSGYAFDIQMVQNGEDALRAYKKWHPDLVILDSVMPVMTGYAALKEMRTVYRDKATPVIMVTSLSKGDDVISFIKLGICGYIVKPFEPDELGAKLMGYYEKVNPERAKETFAVHDSTLQKWRLELEQQSDEQENHDEFWEKDKEQKPDDNK